jgi:SAM-dependent methyltransferase
MEYTQEELERSGYQIKPAPVDDWHTFDERQPVPGYFEFDWLSARHPDLYHRFALSTLGLMDELERLVDLAGLEVIDIGAGTGRSALAAARKAKRVTAVDIFEAVVGFGQEQVRLAGLSNVAYLRADRRRLPFPDDSFDAALFAWAEPDDAEAWRVLKPGGYLIHLGAPLEALCGELTASLAAVYPEIITAVAPADIFSPGCPAADTLLQDGTWCGIPVIPPVIRHDFTCLADYASCEEAAAIFGRLYGPVARRYLLERGQSTVASRLRIEAARVRK